MVAGYSADLGAPLRLYRASVGVWLNLVLGVLFLLLALVGFVSVLLGRSPSRLNGPLFWYIVSTVLGVLLFGIWLWQRTRQVQVYERGFHYQHGSRSLLVRWEEIAAIWRRSVRHSVHFIPVGTSHTFSIQTYGGESLKLTGSIGGVAALGDEIQVAALPYVLSRAMGQLQAGQHVAFSKLQVHQLGLHNGKQLLPWNEVGAITMRNGYLIIKHQGQWRAWLQLPSAQIPNLLVLLTLLDQRQPAVVG